AVTANEIHIPVRTPVRLEVRTADVIHSFWVPELNRKIDTMPGKTNVIELNADRAGRYRGECAEFCGLQHAHMSMYVFVDSAASFSRWVSAQAKPARPAAARTARLERIWQSRPGVLGWLTTTDHKRIGLLYFWATLVLFGAGGVEALLMRTQLSAPNQDVVSPNTYDQLFTMHGLTMIFFFIIPMSTGAFGNYLLPLMIGARDMAFPRMHALSFWLFDASGIFLYTSLFLGIAPNSGWFNYVPLASRHYDPGRNTDFYSLGIIFNSISSALT